MELSIWKSLKDTLRETFDLMLEMDQRSLAVITEGFELVWQDVLAYFSK